MIQLTQTAGALFGVLAVVLGAFGAHALKKVFTPELQQSFETGVRYQMYHALLLILISITLSFETSIEKTVAYLIIIGTLLFSFSIYGLCLSSAFGKKEMARTNNSVRRLITDVRMDIIGLYFY